MGNDVLLIMAHWWR